MAAMLPVHVHGTPSFTSSLALLHDRGDADFAKVEPAVRAILDDVRKEGDPAVLRHVAHFEKRVVDTLYRTSFDGAAALARLPAEARAALEHAAHRITRFHGVEKRQMFGEDGFRYEEDGISLGLRVRPLDRVGVYAPGGKARYPSSVLMAALPARVAGVREIILATPLAGDASDDSVLAAAHLAGVTALVDAGGAQAIAALAFGAGDIPPVPKICGPGNAWVAEAKSQAAALPGGPAIDMPAGPSELMVIADRTANAETVAADLLSQAEHDAAAQVLLVTTDRGLAATVAQAVERQLATLPRRAQARASLTHARLIIVDSLDAAATVANAYAPEHLCLALDDPEPLVAAIANAGAIFAGHAAAETFGDYLAGSSHVLPTDGAARAWSGITTHSFMKAISIQRVSPAAGRALAAPAAALARLESLEAHARAAEARAA